MSNKLKIEVWSDVMCPFCYIGKRMFEQALEKFPYNKDIELEWKAFQLNPSIPDTPPKENILEYFSREKGVSLQEAENMHQRVEQMASSVGLTYHTRKIVIANSFNAHRLSHFAKTKSLEIQDQVEEALFNAYFTEGKNINDIPTLLEIGCSAGLDKNELTQLLNTEEFAYDVKQDIQEASNIGVSGVPFFLFNRKYAISGAQPPEVFLQTLEKAYESWKYENSKIEIIKGDSCSIDGNCE